MFMMLGFPKDVETMVYGGNDDGNSGLLSVMKKGAHLIDHTTSSPGLAQRIAKNAIMKGV